MSYKKLRQIIMKNNSFIISLLILLMLCVVMVSCKKDNASTASNPNTPTYNNPEGSINGLFTVNESGNQVYFSKGNLQYNISTNIWRFAEHQYDYIDQNLFDDDWMDLFGWGTGDNPTNVLIEGDYSSFTDWGNNALSNGGDTVGVWRTLTKEEWLYVLDVRNTGSGIRYSKAQIDGINGVILLPDFWNDEIYKLNNTNCSYIGFDSNVVSLSDWLTKFEANGAVFLPTAGFRNNYVVGSGGVIGNYWSATSISDSSLAWFVLFDNENLSDAGNHRWFGYSVRLVYDKE